MSAEDFCNEQRNVTGGCPCMLPSWHVGDHQNMTVIDGMVQVVYWAPTW